MKEWFEFHKLKLLTGMLLLACVVYFVVSQSQENVEIQLNEQSDYMNLDKNEEVSVSVEGVEVKEWKVDVKGAVVNPGVYPVSQEDRVIDIIQRSGGFTSSADKNQINLSSRVEDEMVIYVPALGEVVAAPEGKGLSNDEQLININKANAEELQKLPGIGDAKAKAIIDYRETNGGFKSLEDMKKISGIGDKTFEKLEPLITIK